MTNKKALSDVVTTVLIVLFAIVAIILVWAVVSNLIGKTSTKITNTAACLDLQIAAVRCSNASATSSYVTVQRGASGSDLNIKSVIALFEKKGTAEIERNASNNAQGYLTGAMTSATITLNNPISNYLRAGVAVELLNPDGSTVTCDYPKTAMISCVAS